MDTSTNTQTTQAAPTNTGTISVVPASTNQSVMVGLVTLIWGVTVLLICFVLYWAMAKTYKRQ